MAEGSKFAKSLKSPFQWIVAGGILFFIVLIGLGPSSYHYYPRADPFSMEARAIGVALFQYTTDHQGMYPSGKSSTEIFQKLLDQQYVSDPILFWDSNVPGKIKPTSNKLKPENVSWDVTIPFDPYPSNCLPMVFLTGYRINYVPGGSAAPLYKESWPRSEGIAVCYTDLTASWQRSQPDGVVTNFISPDFVPDGKKYEQLTPDGPLTP